MSIYYIAGLPYSDELYHYGIPGMRWGIRRFQTKKGELTPKGKARYINKSLSTSTTKKSVSLAGTPTNKTRGQSKKRRVKPSEQKTHADEKTRRRIKNAGKHIKANRAREKEYGGNGTQFASESLSTMLPHNYVYNQNYANLHFRGKPANSSYTFEELYNARNDAARTNEEARINRLQNVGQRYVNRIGPDVKISDIKEIVSVKAKEVKLFISNCGKTAIEAIKTAYSATVEAVKGLLDKLFSKRKM